MEERNEFETNEEIETDITKENVNEKKRFAIYIISAFAMAYALQIIASVLAINGYAFVFSPILAVSMLVPFGATLICGRGLKNMGFKPKLKGKIKWIFIALWGPMIFSVLGPLVFFLIFPKTYDATGMYLLGQMSEEQVAQLKEMGVTFPIIVISQVAQLVTYAPFLNMFFALGEEVGWRGYMYPALKHKFGVNGGRIIGGLIWGIWHWPVIILAGYEYGTDYFGAPFAGPVLFCLCTVVMGIIFDYWYDKSGCIWIPALGHGSFNAAAGLGMLFFNPAFGKYMILGPTPVGIIAMIPMIIYAVYIFVKEAKNNKKTV